MAATRDTSEDAFPDRDATSGEAWFRVGGTRFERMRDTGAVIITMEYPSGMTAVRELSADDWASLVRHLAP